MLREQHRKHFGLRAALRKSRQPIWSYSVEFTHFGQKCEPLYHHLAQSLFDDLLKHSSRPWNHLQLEAVSHCTLWGKFSLEETSEWCTPHCHGHHGNKSSECLPAFILPDLSEALQHLFLPLRRHLAWASIARYFPGVPQMFLRILCRSIFIYMPLYIGIIQAVPLGLLLYVLTQVILPPPMLKLQSWFRTKS